MQGVEATQLVFDCQHSGLLHETLVDLDDAKRRPLLPQVPGCGLARSKADGADRLDVSDAADEPSTRCAHGLADRVAARLGDVALDQRARVQIEVQRFCSLSERTREEALMLLLTS
jgi:hypothetical protein